MTDVDVVVFARYWEPGVVKTRLCPPLTPREAATLSRLMLDVLMSRLRAVPGLRPVITFEPASARYEFESRYPGIALEPQQGIGLSAKLVHVLDSRSEPCLITGADCPTTPLDSFRIGARALAEGADVVLAPTEDGGTHILGARRDRSSWFDGIPWSSGTERDALERRAASNRWDCRRLPLWHDVDTAAELSRLVEEVSGCAANAELPVVFAKATLRTLRSLVQRDGSVHPESTELCSPTKELHRE